MVARPKGRGKEGQADREDTEFERWKEGRTSGLISCRMPLRNVECFLSFVFALLGSGAHNLYGPN